MKTLVETQEVDKCRTLIVPIIETSGHFNMKWLQDNGLIAVPVESACHFNNRDAEFMAKAMQQDGFYSCVAVVTEPLKEFPECFALNGTKEDLLAFSRECSHFNFVIIPTSLSFAILCTV